MYRASAIAAFGLLTSQIAASPLLTPVPPTSLLFPRAPSCPAPVPSCQKNTNLQGSCCYEAPGGLLALTQFWDLDTTGSPPTSWTIHGLWPDHTGQLSSSGQVTFPQDCDESRNYPSAKEVLKANNKSELITFMDKYWLSNKNDNEGLWEHEWNKHGTCMSTLEPGCLPPSSKKGADAALYFQRAVDLFKASDTYSFLAEAGIRPDSRKQFSLEEITQAIKAKHGATPALDCRNGRLSQIYYYFHLQGSAIDGTFLPVEPLKPGSCPKTNISYPPKNGAVTPTSTVTSARPSQTTPTSDVSRATIAVRTSDGTTTGCLLSTGRWSTQTCAKMNIIAVDNGFTLTSSRGDCAIVSGEFTCGNSANPPSVFTATALNGENLLAFDGSTAFSANSIPRGSTQVTLSTGSDGVIDLTLVINGV